MSEKDFAVTTVGIPTVGQVSKKPCYLLTLEDSTSKNKVLTFFIAIDKPDFLNGFIQVKGIFSSGAEETLTKNFNDVLSNTPRESIVDMFFPWHRVFSIKSLVFNALKPSTLMK